MRRKRAILPKSTGIAGLLLLASALLPAQQLSLVAVVDVQRVLEAVATAEEPRFGDESVDQRDDGDRSNQQPEAFPQSNGAQTGPDESLQDLVRDTAAAVAEAEGYQVVVPASLSGLQWWSPGVDITAQVIEELLGERENGDGPGVLE